MKKILIATSAIVAVAGFAASAQAADPIKLSVGGFADWFVGYADQPNAVDDLAADWDVKGNAEVHFTGSTVLDNGLTVAVTMEHEAGGRAQGTIIDKSYVTIGSDSVGTFIIGANDNATVMIAMGAPSYSFVGLNDSDIGDWLSISGQTASNVQTYIDTSYNTEKLTYLSPEFAGLQLGVSLIPSVDQADNVNTIATTGGANVGPAYGVGAIYNREFSGVAFGIEGGYVWANPEAPTGFTSHDEFQVGSNIGFAGFTLGGAYKQTSRDVVGGGDVTATVWELGVGYEAGPYGVALGYLDGDDDGVSGVGSWNMWELSGMYDMGAGVALKSSVNLVEDGVTDNTGWAAMTGLSLSF